MTSSEARGAGRARIEVYEVPTGRTKYSWVMLEGPKDYPTVLAWAACKYDTRDAARQAADRARAEAAGAEIVEVGE